MPLIILFNTFFLIICLKESNETAQISKAALRQAYIPDLLIRYHHILYSTIFITPRYLLFLFVEIYMINNYICFIAIRKSVKELAN